MDNKDLVRQYVDTGLQLTEYQVNSLTGNLLQTYLRKRMIILSRSQWGELGIYEYRLMSEDNQKTYIGWLVKRHDYMAKNMLEYSSDEVKEFYIDLVIAKNDYINFNNFSELTDKLKLKYLKYRIDTGKGFDMRFIEDFTPEMIHAFHYLYATSPKSISEERYGLLPDDLKLVYLERHIEGSDTYEQYSDRTPELKYKYITVIKNRMLNKDLLDITPDNLAMVYLKQRMNQGWDLTPSEKVRYESITNG
jgi:hypothetical protein